MRKRTQSYIALVSAGVLLAATGCGSTADAGGGKETLRVMMFPSQAYRLPVMIAEQEGMFEERGIELEITEQPANLQGMQGLEATESDIGLLTVGTIGQGWQAGEEGAFFCGGIDVLQTTLMAAPDSDLPSIDDGASWEEVLRSLEGLEIGIQTPVGSGLQRVFAGALEEVGIEDVTYVNLGGSSSAAIAALANNSVDVAHFTPTGTQHVLDTESGKPLLYMSEGPSTYRDYYGSGWVGSMDFLEGRPELAEEFCEVMDESLDFIREPDNRETTLELLAEDTGVTDSVAELVLDQGYEEFSTELDQDRLDTTFAAYVDLGILEPEPEPTYDALVADPRQ